MARPLYEKRIRDCEKATRDLEREIERGGLTGQLSSARSVLGTRGINVVLMGSFDRRVKMCVAKENEVRRLTRPELTESILDAREAVLAAEDDERKAKGRPDHAEKRATAKQKRKECGDLQRAAVERGDLVLD